MLRTGCILLSDVLLREDIEIGVQVESKAELFRHLADRAGARLSLDSSKIYDALIAREELGTTGFGRGTALPHAGGMTALTLPIIPYQYEGEIARAYASLLRLARPIDFQSVDDSPVDIVFMSLVPHDQGSTGTHLIAAAARIFRSSRFLQAFRRAATQEAAYKALMDEQFLSDLEHKLVDT